MPLSESKLDQIRAWFADRELQVCFCTPGGENVIAAHLFAGTAILPTGNLLPDHRLPLVAVTCSNCCRVTFYNATEMGFMD